MTTETQPASNAAVEFKEQTAPSLTSTTCLLSLKLQSPGNRRKARLDQVETDADKSMLSLSKELLDSPELAEVKKLDGALRTWIYSRALPSEFRSGVYLLPLALLEDVDAALQRHTTARAGLVDLFAAAYPGRIDDARRRLASQFKATDYPDVEEIKAAFSVQWSYFTIDTPDNLSAVSRAIFEREQRKAAAQWSDATEQIKTVLREAMADLVGHMADRLQPDDAGKSKVFRNSLVANLADFLSTFQARNVTNDSELAAIVTRAQGLLEGVTSQDLRDFDGLRVAVQSNMAEMKATLDTMLTDRPGRAIAAEEE